MFIILVYDVEAKRVAKALKICRKYLFWVQNSVFEGDLTQKQLDDLQKELNQNLNPLEDGVVIYTWGSDRYHKRLIMGNQADGPEVMII